nr:MAG TPA: hypothetical protein [Caudoviricetes sp.]
MCVNLSHLTGITEKTTTSILKTHQRIVSEKNSIRES